MSTAQVGIFALGDASHGFYEFNRAPGIDPQLLVRAVADLKPPRSTVGGVNMVLGFHPELWSTVAPADAPPNVRAFEVDLRGSDGYTMPATQADLFVWFSAASYDVIFDLATSVIEALAGLATLAREETGWSYRHSRDLTGFEDGTENPSLHVAPDIALIPDGKAGAAGSVLLFQKWEHNSSAWGSLPDAQQEAVIGRTKPESIELGEDTMPANSHVTRTKVHDKDGEEMNVFRAGKEISEALGREPDSTDLRKRHPFDVEILRIPLGKMPFPHHSHSMQWEFYHVISGTGIARHSGGRTPIVAGDAFVFEPGEAHQLINDSDGDLLIYVVADNPIGESAYFPDSEKWAVPSPESRVIRSEPVPYYDGEDS